MLKIYWTTNCEAISECFLQDFLFECIEEYLKETPYGPSLEKDHGIMANFWEKFYGKLLIKIGRYVLEKSEAELLNESLKKMPRETPAEVAEKGTKGIL